METHCQHCGEMLKGRSDKRYCNNYCKNAYFNEKKKNEHEQIRSIDLVLKKNRRILRDALAGRKKRIIGENRLLELGFVFKYHTHIVISRTTNRWIFCYDHGYSSTAARKFVLVHAGQS